MALQIDSDNLKELLTGEKPVVLDFWATWCAPCRMISPIIEELAQQYEGKVVIGKVDVEENEDLAVEYGVRNVPTILFIKNGEVVDKQVGAASKSAFEEKIKALL
jgi:thioredoxin 1